MLLRLRREDRHDDRRRTERFAVRGPAQILFGSLPRDCWISDISDGGVRLHAENIEVPDEFTLLLADRKERRECRVAWRLGHDGDARFHHHLLAVLAGPDDNPVSRLRLRERLGNRALSGSDLPHAWQNCHGAGGLDLGMHPHRPG